MANSLRAKLSKLRHDGNITDAEYQELIKKLDGHDAEIYNRGYNQGTIDRAEEVTKAREQGYAKAIDDCYMKAKTMMEELVCLNQGRRNGKTHRMYCIQALEFLRQVAEEFATDINVGNKLQTIDVSELLGEQGNDGWISVEDKLPELTEGTECFKQSKCCLTTLRWWDGDMTESVGWYNQSGVWNEDSKNCKVVAWMPLPPKYQPKGE